MGFIEVMDWMAGALQFVVAGYALRLNRLFGSVRVGWSLFWAFLLLALLHLVQAFVPLEVANVSQLQNEVAMSYALISLLLLTSMVHLERILKERLKVERKEQQMVAALELEVQKKTDWLTKAVEALQTEIDERKRTEKEMQRFQFTTDQAGDGVFWINQDAGFYYVNDEACRSLGYTREELMRMNLFAVDPNLSVEQWKAAWQRAENKEVIVRQFESAHRRKDGSTFPVEINAKHFSMAGINLHIAFVRDITERKQAEEKNRQQAILLDEASDAIWGLDLNDRINFWNKGAERIYGWNATEAVGKTLPDLLHRGTTTPMLEECVRTVKERGAWSGEFEDVTKDGRSIVIHRRCNAIYDERGQRSSLLMINTDVTEKKRTDAQFLRSQRMESLGTLAGGIAHDLNNILSPLLFSVYLLREKVSDKEGLQLLTTMETSVQRGAQLIKQVLAFGRGIQVERVPIHLKQLVHEVEQIIRETFPKHISLNVHLADELWDVKGDVTQIHQVLLNLCVNARDSMPVGGHLSIQVQNIELDGACVRQNPDAKPGHYVVIKVADTGSGIPGHIIDRIFEPFFTTKELHKGTGLGLSTSLGIVRSHGGFIHCNSEIGKGSVFTVYLPATANTRRAVQPAGRKTTPIMGNNELVMIVDDEKPIRDVAKKTLERSGFRVVTAANGAEAVSIYREQRNEIAAVLIDMAMPIMDGHAAIIELKAINPAIRIIGASGLDTPKDSKGDDNFGCEHFLAKPYTAENLVHTLNLMLTVESTR